MPKPPVAPRTAVVAFEGSLEASLASQIRTCVSNKMTLSTPPNPYGEQLAIQNFANYLKLPLNESEQIVRL